MSKQKNKLLLAICAMCIAFLSVVGTLIGVLAASTQSVGSLFSVSYDVGDNIATRITAYYQFEGDEGLTSLGTLQKNVDGTSQGEISAVNLDFTPETTTMRFVWVFENIGEQQFYVNWDWEALEQDRKNDTNNVIKNIYWGFDAGSRLEQNTYGAYASIEEIPSEIEKPTRQYQPFDDVLVDAEHPCVIILNITVADINKEAYLKSVKNNFVGKRGLEFSLETSFRDYVSPGDEF